MKAENTKFVQEIAREIVGVPIGRLPGVIKAIRDARNAPRMMMVGTSVNVTSVEMVARMVLTVDANGSKLRAVENAAVLEAVRQANGNISQAARLLGLDRKAMERRVKNAMKSQKKKIS